MVDELSASQSVAQARQNVELARQTKAKREEEISQAETQLREFESRLPNEKTQRSLRQQFAGLAGRKQRQALKSIREDIGSKRGEIEQFKGEVSSYGKDIETAEKNINQYESQYLAESFAYDTLRNKIEKDFSGGATKASSINQIREAYTSAGLNPDEGQGVYENYITTESGRQSLYSDTGEFLGTYNVESGKLKGAKGYDLKSLKRGVLEFERKNVDTIIQGESRSGLDRDKKLIEGLKEFQPISFTPATGFGVLSAQPELQMQSVNPNYQPPVTSQSKVMPNAFGGYSLGNQPFSVPAPKKSVFESPKFEKALSFFVKPQFSDIKSGAMYVEDKRVKFQLNRAGLEYTPANVQALKEYEAPARNTANFLTLGLGTAPTTQFGVKGVTAIEKANQMLANVETASAKNTADRIKTLEKFGFDNPTKGIVEAKPFSYVGAGTEAETLAATKVLKTEFGTLAKNSKNPLEIKDVGVYSQKTDVYRLARDIDLAKGAEIQNVGLPSLKYNSYLEQPITQEKYLATSVFEKGYKAKGFGASYSVGKSGKPIDKNVLTLTREKGVSQFNTFGSTRKSTKNFPLDGQPPVVVDIFPTAKLTGKEVSKTKLLTAKKDGSVVNRLYETSFKEIPVKKKDVNVPEILSTLFEKPNFKQKGINPRSELVQDTIIKGKPKGEIKLSAIEDVATGSVKIKTDFVQTASSFPSGTKYITESGGVVKLGGTGKKSSNQYLKQLYADNVIALPKQKVKIVTPKAPKVPESKLINTQNPSVSYGKSNVLSGVAMGSRSQQFSRDILGDSSDFNRAFSEKTLSTQKTSAFETTGSSVFSDLSTRQNTGQNNQFGFSESKIDLKTKVALELRTPQRTAQAQEPILKTQQRETEILKIPQKEIQKSALKVLQNLKTEQATRQVQRTSQTFSQKTKTPRIPRPRIKLTSKFKSKRTARDILEDTYSVFVRKKGQDIGIGEFGSQREAESELGKELRKTLRASGFIERRGERINTNLFGFTKSKRDPTRIVQPKGKRLSARSETQEIQFLKGKRNRSSWRF